MNFSFWVLLICLRLKETMLVYDAESHVLFNGICQWPVAQSFVTSPHHIRASLSL